MTQKPSSRSGKSHEVYIPTSVQCEAFCNEPSRNLRLLYEDVIAHACAPGLAQLYQGLPEASKKKLLQALREAMRGYFTMLQPHDGKVPEGDFAPDVEQYFMSGSIAKALQLELKAGIHVPVMILAQIQGLLQKWGRGVTMSKEELRLDVERQNALKAKQNAQCTETRSNLVNSSKGVTKPESQRSRNVGSFKAITVSDLEVFAVAKGCSLSGVLATKPISLLSVLVHLEDANGDIVPVALYNQIPGGKPSMEVEEDYVKRNFPQGSKLTVIEPFYKIAVDGQRVIRVDDPADVILTLPPRGSAADGSGQADLQDAIEQSRKLLKGGNAAMAMDTILKALQTPDAGVENIVKVLGNRSQAQLRAGNSAAALRDSATVLLLRPSNSKAWQRYHAALQSLQMERTAERARIVMDSRTRAEDGDTSVTAAQGGSGFPSAKERPSLLETHQVLEKCLNLWPTMHGDSESSEMSSEDLKLLGDALFRGGKFTGAISKYSQALASAPCMIDVARACAQLARCTLECNGYHTALAAAAAAVWIVLPAAQSHARFEKPLRVFLQLQIKALVCLGVGANDDCPHTSNECPQNPQNCGAWLLRRLAEGMTKSNVPCIARASEGKQKSSKVPVLIRVDENSKPHRIPYVELADGLEHRDVAGKGRGLFATRHFAANDIVLSNRPLAIAAKESSFQLWSFNESDVLGASQVSLASQLSFLAAKDAKVALALSHLDHIKHFRSKDDQKSSNTSRNKAAKRKPLVSVGHPNSMHSEKSSGSQKQSAETVAKCDDESAADSKLPLVHHLPDMLQTLSPLVLPLLPQLWEYFPASEHLQLSSERLSRIVSINTFGDHDGSVRSFQEILTSGCTIYTIISLLNHSDQPNVEISRMRSEQGCSKSSEYALKMLTATRDIKPGEELTIRYTRDQEALREKWGIRAA